MKAEVFNKIVEERIAKIRELTSKKAVEYAIEGDRLYNFKAGSEVDGKKSPIQVCWGYMLKPLVSVKDMLKSDNPGRYSKEMVDEKIGDLIMYLILQEGLLAEARSKEDNKIKLVGSDKNTNCLVCGHPVSNKDMACEECHCILLSNGAFFNLEIAIPCPSPDCIMGILRYNDKTGLIKCHMCGVTFKIGK